MDIRKLDERFSVTAQISPEQIDDLAAQGFTAIVCARPDNEELDQPRFEAIAAAARAKGIRAYHIPVSGQLGEGQIIRFHQAMSECDGPIIGYCRSGARAGSLHAALTR